MSFPITLDEIERAYDITGMEPVEACWVFTRLPENKRCGCPLAALVALRCDFETSLLIQGEHDEHGFAALKLGISRDQAVSFTTGFDGDVEPSDSDPEAYAAGLAARDKFIPERRPS